MNMINNGKNRRTFLKDTLLVAVSISLPGFISCSSDQSETVPNKERCMTSDDILGPFYKAGAPFREDIIPAENTAPSLYVQGKVFSNCDSALKDALVEVWNADDSGEYDASSEFKFRGSYQTLADGGYSFRTIVPGRYLNGGTFRPSHIHFRVTAPGHQELVSQIYFKDDPFINDDPWAASEKASERILTLGKGENGEDTVSFNIYLTPA